MTGHVSPPRTGGLQKIILFLCTPTHVTVFAATRMCLVTRVTKNVSPRVCMAATRILAVTVGNKLVASHAQMRLKQVHVLQEWDQKQYLHCALWPLFWQLTEDPVLPLYAAGRVGTRFPPPAPSTSPHCTVTNNRHHGLAPCHLSPSQHIAPDCPAAPLPSWREERVRVMQKEGGDCSDGGRRSCAPGRGRRRERAERDALVEACRV